MTVRLATAGDVPAVIAIETALFGADAWTATQVGDELLGAGRRAWVSGDPVSGYAVTWTVGDVVDLQRIAVLPDVRRRGVARRLLAAAVESGKESHADRMLLEVSAANTAALAFYASAGFVEIHRRRRYYRDGTDAVVMRMPLSAAACGGRG